MKYEIGQEFILQTSLGPKKTVIKDIKYEFADYIKGGPKYVNEKDVETYIANGTLTPDGKMSQKYKDIQALEEKYGIHLAEVDYNNKVIVPE